MIASRRLSSARAVYVDTTILIYFIDGDEMRQRLVGSIWEGFLAAEIHVHISEIGAAGCIYGVCRDIRSPNFRHRLNAYESLFTNPRLIKLVPVTAPLLDIAARTGPELGLKLIDSIHYQSAITARCDCLVTNDRSFRSSPAMNIIQLSDLSES